MACLGSLCSAIRQIHDLSPFQIASMDSLAVERLAQYVRLFLEEVAGAEETGTVYSTYEEASKRPLVAYRQDKLSTNTMS